MRLDRLITLGVVQPAGRALGHYSARRLPAAFRRLPILMYHSIADDSETSRSDYYKVCTSPARFAEQMQWLADWGYRGVTLSEAIAALQTPDSQDPSPDVETSSPSHSRPANLVAITFDDGFRDFHTAAFPVLHRHKFTATMYLPTAFIGHTRQKFKSRECLTWSEVVDLRLAGNEFGAHTVNHPRLAELSWADIEAELHQSKATIERELGIPVRSFAYPYDYPQAAQQFVSRFRELLSRLGYLSSVTTIIGRTQPDVNYLELPRLPINSADDQALFAAKLSGAYDWVSNLQALSKRIGLRLRPRN